MFTTFYLETDDELWYTGQLKINSNNSKISRHVGPFGISIIMAWSTSVAKVDRIMSSNFRSSSKNLLTASFSIAITFMESSRFDYWSGNKLNKKKPLQMLLAHSAVVVSELENSMKFCRKQSDKLARCSLSNMKCTVLHSLLRC